MEFLNSFSSTRRCLGIEGSGAEVSAPRSPRSRAGALVLVFKTSDVVSFFWSFFCFFYSAYIFLQLEGLCNFFGELFGVEVSICMFLKILCEVNWMGMVNETARENIRKHYKLSENWIKHETQIYTWRGRIEKTMRYQFQVSSSPKIFYFGEGAEICLQGRRDRLVSAKSGMRPITSRVLEQEYLKK